MNRERELLERSVRIIESLGPDYEAYNLIDKIEELLAQPEHIPDVGNMVTQEPVYWENEKKALLNEIDHLTNRLTQPEQDNTQYLLDQVSRLTAENAMLKEKWSPPKFEPLGLEIMDVCGSEDYREGFKDGALYAEKAHGITE